MAAGHTTLFVVRNSTDLARVSDWLARTPRAQLIMDISDDEGALAESELRSLFDDAWDAHATLSVATDDPLIAEICRIHGVALTGEKLRGRSRSAVFETAVSAQELPDERAWHDALTAVRIRVEHDEQPRLDDTAEAADVEAKLDIDSAELAISGGSDAVTQRGPQRYDEHAERFSYSDASFAFVVAPPTPRRADVPLPGQVSQPPAPAFVQRRPATHRRRAAFLSAAALVGALLGIGAILIGFLAPYTTVQLTPLSATIAAEITYGIEGSAPGLDLALPPRAVSKTVTFEATIPTTGERFEPDLAARGEALFTNPTTGEAFIPAGTPLYSDDGREYLTTADLSVPAADPFGSLTFGSAAVEVVASAAGPAGNLPAEALTGQLDSGVYFSNREPLAGGTEQRIAVVSEADTAALEQQARDAFAQHGESELVDQLNQGEQLVSGSLERGEPQLALDQQVGADAPQLTVRGTLELRGAAYDPAELHAAAEEALNAELPALVPRGQLLVADSLTLGAPQPLDAGNAMAFRLSGSAETRAIVSPEQLDAARSDLVGADSDKATQVVAGIPGVASSTVEVGPDWLPFGRQPRLKSRITIEVVDEGSEPASAAQQTGP